MFSSSPHSKSYLVLHTNLFLLSEKFTKTTNLIHFLSLVYNAPRQRDFDEVNNLAGKMTN